MDSSIVARRHLKTAISAFVDTILQNTWQLFPLQWSGNNNSQQNIISTMLSNHNIITKTLYNQSRNTVSPGFHEGISEKNASLRAKDTLPE